MNVVKILLILGLGYVALNQKVEKTRNMLLVVTGLLAFCIFSMEGFAIATGAAMGNIFTGATGGSDNAGTRDDSTSVVVTGSDRYTFSGNAEINLNGTAPVPPAVTCKTGTNGDTAGTVGYKPGVANWVTTPTRASIDNYLTCVARPVETPGQSCSAGKTAGKKCPDYYKYKVSSTDNCAADPCVDNDFTANGGCCEKVCSDTDCEKHILWGFWLDGAECGPSSGWTAQKCKTDS